MCVQLSVMANNLYPAVSTALDGVLRANGGAVWNAAWRAVVVRSIVVPQALRLFNAETTTFEGSWAVLDDEPARVAAARVAALEGATVTELLLRRDVLNAALKAAGLHEERPTGLRRYLTPLVKQLVADPLSATALSGIFPSAWRFVSDAIAVEARARRVQRGQGLEDWRAINERLAAGFLAACALDRAALAEQVLRRVGEEWPLGIRGRFVRLTEQIGADGVDDAVPPVVPPPVLGALSHSALSDVIVAAADAWTTTEQGNGVMHRFMGAHINAIPASGLPPGRTLAEVVAARSAAYRQHEYTITSYLALVGIEQLLRGAAARAGIQHVDDPVLEWVNQLGLSAVGRDAVAAIYDRRRGNVRNRFMHAGLLDIESKRMEQVLVAAGLRPALPAQDPYAPRNIAALCVSSLATLDAEIARPGVLAPAHFAWTSQLDLSPAELQIGTCLPFDFARPEGIELQRQMSDFLTVVAPAMSQLFRVGFVGWIQRATPNTLPMFAAMLVVFEGLARTVVHLCGLPVLQWDDRNGRCQYLMFDERGLASHPVRAHLLAELPTRDVAIADQVLALAIKARNAFAHGAVLSPQGTYFDAVGQFLMKASLTFMSAAENHLIREAAFFEGERSGRGDLDNWLAAETRLLGDIAKAAASRRRPEISRAFRPRSRLSAG